MASRGVHTKLDKLNDLHTCNSGLGHGSVEECMLSRHKTVDSIPGTMSLDSGRLLTASSCHRGQIRGLNIAFAFTEWFN